MRTKLIYYEWGKLHIISVSFFSIIILVTTILLSVRISKVEIDGFKGVIAPIIFLIMGVIGLIFGFLLVSIKRRQKKIDHWSPGSVESKELEQQVISSSEIEAELSEVRNKEAIDWNKVHPLIIKQRNVDQKCPICKLPIEREDFIVHCPHCSHLFHGKHLIEWLLEQKSCPVCRNRIDIR